MPLEYLGKSIQAEVVDGLGITLTRYADSEAQPWHFHEQLNVSLLLEGSFVDESRELGQRHLGPFDVVVHPRGALHRSCPSGAGRLSLNLEPVSLWSEMPRYRVGSMPELGIAAYQYLLGNERGLGDALLECLWGEGGEKEQSAWFRRMDSVIAEREDWTLSELAKELGVHPVYLARVYRAKMGKTVTSFLRERRLIRAAKEFIATKECGSLIALKFGYSDAAHFHRHFRIIFGMTPHSARKKFQIFNP